MRGISECPDKVDTTTMILSEFTKTCLTQLNSAGRESLLKIIDLIDKGSDETEWICQELRKTMCNDNSEYMGSMAMSKGIGYKEDSKIDSQLWNGSRFCDSWPNNLSQCCPPGIPTTRNPYGYDKSSFSMTMTKHATNLGAYNSNFDTRSSTDVDGCTSFETVMNEDDFSQAEKALKRWCEMSLGCGTTLEGLSSESETTDDNRGIYDDLNLDITWRLSSLAACSSSCPSVIDRFRQASQNERHILLLSLLPDTLRLSMDPVGMALVQACFNLGTSAQQWLLAQQLSGEILRISLSPHGCRVIQTAIETREPRILDMIENEIRGHTLRLLEDQNGNHVLQKFIENVPIESLGFIIDIMKHRIATLSIHSFGCRVIQRLLERRSEINSIADKDSLFSNVQNGLTEITKIIIEKAPILSHNQFGNYVVQHIFTCGKNQDRKQLINILKDKLVSFSTQKFACNVIEKALQVGTENEKQLLIQAALSGTPPSLVLLMPDRYGNYVAQRILEMSTGPTREEIISIVWQQSECLANTPYGRHILVAAQRLSTKDVPENQKNDICPTRKTNNFSVTKKKIDS